MPKYNASIPLTGLAVLLAFCASWVYFVTFLALASAVQAAMATALPLQRALGRRLRRLGGGRGSGMAAGVGLAGGRGRQLVLGCWRRHDQRGQRELWQRVRLGETCDSIDAKWTGAEAEE